MKSTIKIYSNRFKRVYNIERWKEYQVELDLEQDSDGFTMTVENPAYTYSGMFSRFDPYEIYLNGTGVIKGILDSVKYISGDSNNYIQFVGRDIAQPLIDNDATPATKKNIKPATYIAGKCSDYDILCSMNDTPPVISSYEIGVGTSELSICKDLLADTQCHIWTDFDKLYMGEWATGATPSYTFTRGISGSKMGIPFKTIESYEDGTDMASEYVIYKSASTSGEKVVGHAYNDYMKARGINKRKTISLSTDDVSSKSTANVYKNIKESFRSNTTITLTLHTDTVIKPNRTASIIDTKLKINTIGFIKGVTYAKDMDSGTITTVECIPADSSLNVIWTDSSSSSVSGSPTLTFEQLLAQRR